jgi:hypothetical protein
VNTQEVYPVPYGVIQYSASRLDQVISTWVPGVTTFLEGDRSVLRLVNSDVSNLKSMRLHFWSDPVYA